MFNVWAQLDIHLPLSKVAEAAQRAEAMGFDCLTIPDNMHDGLVASAIALQATKTIKVGTSALVCFPRSPMTTAVAVWDLSEFSGGRFRLGLGPLVAPNIVKKYSVPWSPPAPRIREYIQSLRAIFNCWQHGDPLDYRGKHYSFTLQQDYVKPSAIDHPDIPVHLAAIGPNMTALAGEIANGLMTHPTNSSPQYIREVMLPNLERGFKRTQRGREDIELVSAPLCAIGSTTAEIMQQREQHRHLLATILSTPNYWPNLELLGHKELGIYLNNLVREGRWDEMSAQLNDDILDTMVPQGHFDSIAETLKNRYSGLIDTLSLALPADPTNDNLMASVIDVLRH